MPTNILMPSSIAPGTVARWLKKEGDPVSRGDFLVQIESDKSSVDVEAEQDGVLTKILVPEGTAGVEADAVLAILSPA